MESSRYLIDTNAIIDYLGGELPPSGMSFMNELVNIGPRISVITKMELLGVNIPNEHYKLLQDFVEDATIFDLTDEVTEITIEIRKRWKRKLPDAIIAATALSHRSDLITRNIRDFIRVDGLKIINPHDL